MAKFLYQLAFNPQIASPTETQTHTFITQHRDIESWYLAFPGNYLLKSDKLLVEIHGPFLTFFGQSQFTLTYLTQGLMGGVLPQSIWQWVNQLDPPLLTSPGN
jgi:hypothetical protein